MNVINPHRFATAFQGFGNASRDFDGGTDAAIMGDVLDTTWSGTGVACTFAAWIKPALLDSDNVILGKINSNPTAQFRFSVFSTGEIGFIMYAPNLAPRFGRQTSTSGGISANAWHHVAVVYDQTATSAFLKLYIDGVEYSEGDAELVDWASSGTFVSITDTASDLMLGRTIANAGSFIYDGKMADVRVYDADIGASNIAGLANGTDYQTNLVGWWITDVDDGTTTLVDYSVNSNDASMTTPYTTAAYDTDGPNG